MDAIEGDDDGYESGGWLRFPDALGRKGRTRRGRCGGRWESGPRESLKDFLRRSQRESGVGWREVRAVRRGRRPGRSGVEGEEREEEVGSGFTASEVDEDDGKDEVEEREVAEEAREEEEARVVDDEREEAEMSLASVGAAEGSSPLLLPLGVSSSTSTSASSLLPPILILISSASASSFFTPPSPSPIISTSSLPSSFIEIDVEPPLNVNGPWTSASSSEARVRWTQERSCW